jgi:hypothetical protein
MKGTASGVGTILRKALKSRIKGYSWMKDRTSAIKIKICSSHCYIP